MGELFNVPTLPDNFLPRPEDLAALKDAVLGQSKQAVAVTGKAVGGGRNVSIQGMGGIGKSVLATALVRDPAVRQAYGDGLFWVSLGQTPNLVALQANLATDLGDEKPSFTDVNEGKAELGRLLKDKHCLVVLDDIWDLRHYNAAFDALGDQCQLLLTTRDNSIANRLSSFSYPLEELERNKALELLQRWTNVEQLPDVAENVARECGYLPLALAMVGAYLRDKPQRWERILEKLRAADLEKHKINKQLLPGYQYELFRAIQVSVEALDEVGDLTAEEVQERYFDFAVFPEDMAIPEAVLETFWQPLGLDEDDTEELLDELVDKSLLQRDEQGRLTLHDLQYDYICKRTKDEIAALHQRWLGAYKKKCEQGWSEGPQDGYFFIQLTRHLKKAGEGNELKELLLNYDWLWIQLNANGVHRLITDYDWLANDKTLKLLQNTLRLSAHVLVHHPGQLTTRLWGHLRDREEPEFINLLNQGASQQNSTWLQPQQAKLTSPEGPLLRTFEGHSWSVWSVALSQDGSNALSGSHDNTMKLWSMETGEVLRTFEDHSAIWSVALSNDGRYALSGADDNTMKLWDVKTGEVLRIFEDHDNTVRTVALSQDASFALSGSYDNTMKLWSMETGEVLRTFEGHNAGIESIALSCSRRYALSGSGDNTMKLWDVETGEVLRTFEGHSARIQSVALSQDARHALSGADDNTMKLWNVETGEILRTFMGHSAGICSVALSLDKAHALSSSYDNTIKLWNVKTGEILRTFEGHDDTVRTVALSHDGYRILSGADDNTIKLWDIETSEVLHTYESHNHMVKSVVLEQDKLHAWSSSYDNTMKLWDVKTGEIIYSLFRDHNNILLGRALSHDGQYELFGAGNVMKLCDMETEETLCTFGEHNYGILAVALSDDGQYALSGSNDCTLKLWDVKTREVLHTFEGHSGEVWSVALSNGGKYVLSGSEDKTIKLWDGKKGNCLATFCGDHIFNTCDISNDGTTIVAGDAAGTVHFFSVIEPGE